MLHTLDEPDLLRRGLAQLQSGTSMPVVFGGLVKGKVLRLTEFRGTRTDALRDVVVHCGAGLGGRVTASAAPLTVEDYAHESKISHEYDQPVSLEGLRSVAAVPVVVDRDVLAVLYAGLRQPHAIGERALVTAMRVARHVAQELTIQREVERRLAGITDELARDDPATVMAREEVRAAYAEIRTLATTLQDEAVKVQLHRIGAMLSRATGGAGVPMPAARLAAREIDVLALVALGCPNVEVARRLGLSRETVKSYLRSASRKLGAHGRAEAVVKARRAGALP